MTTIPIKDTVIARSEATKQWLQSLLGLLLGPKPIERESAVIARSHAKGVTTKQTFPFITNFVK
jgi:hypothetical protein